MLWFNVETPFGTCRYMPMDGESVWVASRRIAGMMGLDTGDVIELAYDGTVLTPQQPIDGLKFQEGTELVLIATGDSV